jgi:hypothetical protein
MKKGLIVGLVAFVILVVGFRLWPRTTEVPQFDTQTMKEQTVKVSPIKTQVFISPLVDEQAGTYGTSSEVLGSIDATATDRLKTSHDGRALIEGTHTAVVDSDTEIVLASLNIEEKRTGMVLELGKIWSRAEKLFDKGEFYEIETKNAHAVVRGTSFGVGYRDETTRLTRRLDLP